MCSSACDQALLFLLPGRARGRVHDEDEVRDGAPAGAPRGEAGRAGGDGRAGMSFFKHSSSVSHHVSAK